MRDRIIALSTTRHLAGAGVPVDAGRGIECAQASTEQQLIAMHACMQDGGRPCDTCIEYMCIVGATLIGQHVYE